MTGLWTRLLLAVALLCGGLAASAAAFGQLLPREAEITFAASQWRGNLQGVYRLSYPRGLIGRVNNERVEWVTWTEDGDRIVFKPVVGRQDYGAVYLTDPLGRQVQPFAPDMGFIDYVSFAPDGQRAAIAARVGSLPPEIFVTDADGGNRRRLTFNHASDTGPAWSPDGQRIAFTSTRDDDVEIYLMDADGGNITRLTHSRDFDGYPAWSPDGSRILFVSYRDNLGGGSVYIMNADGSGVQRLRRGLDGGAYGAGWSPDGQTILFGSVVASRFFQMVVMDAEGSGARRLLTRDGNFRNPVWRP